MVVEIYKMKVQESNNSVISREIADRLSLQQAKVPLSP